MEFVEATDRLMQEGVTVEEIGKALGVVLATAKAYRLDPSSTSHRRPPADWPQRLAGLARTRSVALAALAEEIEREGK